MTVRLRQIQIEHPVIDAVKIKRNIPNALAKPCSNEVFGIPASTEKAEQTWPKGVAGKLHHHLSDPPGPVRIIALPKFLASLIQPLAMSKYFRPWNIDQTLLLPPNVQDFVPRGHVSRFIVELVRESLDLKEITGSYGERARAAAV